MVRYKKLITYNGNNYRKQIIRFREEETKKMEMENLNLINKNEYGQ